VSTGKALQQLVVRPETALIRPYVVAAVLRGVTFDATRYNSFIDLQVHLAVIRMCWQAWRVKLGSTGLALGDDREECHAPVPQLYCLVLVVKAADYTFPVYHVSHVSLV
jgi:hypothetical protein